MVNGIPIYKVELGEGYVQKEVTQGQQIFAYAIEATRGPTKEPIFISSNSEAKRIFGVNFAPHFYQKGASGIYLCRVEFPEMSCGTLIYQAKVDDSNDSELVDIIKIEAVTPGTAQHKVNIIKSPTSSKAYNLVVTIDGVGSKKYQNISSLENVVKRINGKFADYLKAELLFDEKEALALKSTEALVKVTENNETKFNKIAISSLTEESEVYAKGPFSPDRLVSNANNVTITGGSNGRLRTTKGDVSNVVIPAGGVESIPDSSVGTGDNDANIEATLLYAYREAFEILEDYDVVGVATLSDSEIVQNELIEHINKLIDPEVYKYRMGVTGYLDYPKDLETAVDQITVDDLANATTHIDNPFIIFIGQGVIFEEEGIRYNLLPYQAVQLYTGLRSSLNYGESIYGGNAKKVLTGVKDKLPLTTDGVDIIKEDIEKINEAGVITFKKEYGEVTFLEGVTTAQSPVLSHESVVMIVLNVLKRLIRVSKPYQGENVTEDLKSSLINALNNELKNITDTDKTLVALEDYNIPPYAVEVKTTVMAGFNEAGEYIRETHYLVIVKIVPVGTLRSITLSVIVI